MKDKEVPNTMPCEAVATSFSSSSTINASHSERRAPPCSPDRLFFRHRRVPPLPEFVSHSSSDMDHVHNSIAIPHDASRFFPHQLGLGNLQTSYFSVAHEEYVAAQDKQTKNFIKSVLLNTESSLESRWDTLEKIKNTLYSKDIGSYSKKGIVDVLLDVLNSKIEDAIHCEIIDVLIELITIPLVYRNDEFCISVGAQ